MLTQWHWHDNVLINNTQHDNDVVIKMTAATSTTTTMHWHIKWWMSMTAAAMCHCIEWQMTMIIGATNNDTNIHNNDKLNYDCDTQQC